MGAALLMITSASPAQAHYSTYNVRACGPISIQECGYGWVSSDHRQAGACDSRDDGRGFYLVFEKHDGRRGVVRDTNDHATGCGLGPPGLATPAIARYYVCSDRGSNAHICRPWKTS
ncbi:hypothetical protein [Nonomuraea candida]|uniref:hypothetical protein n=1 Tax=Nonomuraea candida TaxID=359159 RepID=UPI0005BB7709|nr:hypothetical protein [Nonomuraea candida]